MPTVSTTVIKYINLAVGTIAILSSLIQFIYIYKNFTEFLLAMSSFALAFPIILLEFKVPPDLHRFASFYFSFLGRGLLYILLSFMLAFGGLKKILADIFIFLVGIVFICFQFLPDIEEPRNFRPTGGSVIAIGEDDDIGDVI
ncbi:hypothetical protein TBLA_0E04290 [Henningerozyma blattae CBS 6284]|uniref:Golgi apparatus membrane protein TVP15 n=1 Tax=Henningerozyma blattae (strain ATCC 34711 / CBS 6284 / DSM 70876 / NBRC 10599 / NRRL Y-10934 / UCD 77-7) TaxID=1071380 RepID=I2H531_HENB6|nr:hypothetical protein TBLA_0E04290 [Tetrapisispora blattae CBS 6284]CCH61483.1 hypothetical protein TBLA_0E04290 [Tetrapisispora blattae CBS 6284]